MNEDKPSFTLSLERLHEYDACNIEGRAEELYSRGILRRDDEGASVKEIPLQVWWELTTTSAEDCLWALNGSLFPGGGKLAREVGVFCVNLAMGSGTGVVSRLSNPELDSTYRGRVAARLAALLGKDVDPEADLGVAPGDEASNTAKDRRRWLFKQAIHSAIRHIEDGETRDAIEHAERAILYMTSTADYASWVSRNFRRAWVKKLAELLGVDDDYVRKP